MMLSQVLTALTLVSAASANFSPFFQYRSGAPQPYVYGDQMVAAPAPAGDAEELPCDAAGFFPHPSDCSRFYRCVDYAGTGQFFSRYAFQCPPGQMFLTVGKDTCVPGNCEGVVPLPEPSTAVDQSGASDAAYPGAGVPTVEIPAPSQPAPAPVTGGGAYPAPALPAQPSSQTTGAIFPPAGAVGSGAGAYPGSAAAGSAGAGSAAAGSAGAYPGSAGSTAGTGGSVGGGAYPSAGGAGAGGAAGVGPADAGAAPGYPNVQPVNLACPQRYVQDPEYCNIYVPCPGDGNRYVCTTGSVFDQARQMCRLNSRADDVCAGKKMYDQAVFRSSFFVPQPSSAVYQASPQIYSVGGAVQQQPLTWYTGPQQVASFPTYQQQPFVTYRF